MRNKRVTLIRFVAWCTIIFCCIFLLLPNRHEKLQSGLATLQPPEHDLDALHTRSSTSFKHSLATNGSVAQQKRSQDKYTTSSAGSADLGYWRKRKEFGNALELCNCSSNLTIEHGDVNQETPAARINRWIQNAAVLINCPDLTVLFKRDELVPPILHRIWECDEIPEQYSAALDSWIQNYSNGLVALWTRELRERFISQKHGSVGVKLYQRLIPGAYRADLFRYAVMYYIGGIYSDIDSTLHVSLSKMHYLFRGVTIAVDIVPSRLLNGAILIAPPGNCLFRCAWGEAFDHSERREHFESDLDVTGPGVLGECLRHIVGKDSVVFDESNGFDPGLSGFRLFNSELVDDSNRHIVTLSNGSMFISLEHGGKDYNRQVKPECDPGEHYSTIHRRKGVYRDRS